MIEVLIPCSSGFHRVKFSRRCSQDHSPPNNKQKVERKELDYTSLVNLEFFDRLVSIESSDRLPSLLQLPSVIA